tara:strand:+ start:334 stop:1245 length:912 start_codon:yes stop_codon:yes gene_type:complete
MKNPFSSFTKKIIKLFAKKKEPPEADMIVLDLKKDTKITMEEAKKNDRLFYPIQTTLSDPGGDQKYLCLYTITIYPRPFIEYFLYEENGVLSFPKYAQSLIGDGDLNMGVKEYADHSYIFYKIPRRIKKSYKWVLVDEICNHRKCQNFQISEVVHNLFIDHPSLIYLRKGGRALEVPSVGYTGHNKKDNMTIALGSKNEKKEFGYYYYFSNYDEIKKSPYIIRYALFLDKVLVRLNRSNDEVLSEKSNLLSRIEDPEGKWAEQNDSLYVGKIKLADGNFYRKNPLFVVKKYDQHVVLSWEKNI